jgi:predicted kinase
MRRPRSPRRTRASGTFQTNGKLAPDWPQHEAFRCEVVLMSGLPGAGKDTWVRRHLPDWPVISLDALRDEMDVDPRDEQGAVVQAAREQARAYLRAGRSFVWSATNLSRMLRASLVELFFAYDARVRIVYVEAAGSEALWRQNRAREGRVPAAVIRAAAGAVGGTGGDGGACGRVDRGVRRMTTGGSAGPDASVSAGKLAGKLRELQNQLLDLSRRNRLLNFRPGKGASSLTVVDEVAGRCFARSRSIAGRCSSSPGKRPPRRSQRRWRARRTPDPTRKRSRTTRTPYRTSTSTSTWTWASRWPRSTRTRSPAATGTGRCRPRCRVRSCRRGCCGWRSRRRAALDEQGSNILYVTLGVVAWRDIASGDVVSLAPLLMLPVELERKSVGSRHTVRLLDEDIVANPSLIELAKRVFGVTIAAPDLGDDFDLDAYFRSVADAVAPLRWTVDHHIHVGLFSFAKLLMYRDLDPASWPEGASVVDHALVQQLLGVPPPRAAGQHRGA